MANHINELFRVCSPKEEQRSKLLFKILNKDELNQYKEVEKPIYIKKRGRWIRPVIACVICMLIVTGVFAYFGAENTFSVYAYGEDIEMTDTGVELATGTIDDDGEMQGQLMQMYVKGENIDTIRFSCKYQYIDFTDWSQKRTNFSMEKQFTVSYGKDTSDYNFLVINWNPLNTISQLTDNKNSSIASLSEELKKDIIVMEVKFEDGSKLTKALNIDLQDDGKISAKILDYNIKQDDDFVLNPPKNVPLKKQSDNDEALPKVTKYSENDIEAAKAAARDYYSKFNGEHEIISIEYTENSQYLNNGVNDKYKDSDIIAFKSYEKSNPGIARTILLARDNTTKSWVVINEGY